MDDIELTEREMLVAKMAAKIAVREMQDEVYKQVGKTVVHKMLTWIGILVVGYMAGKGWISLK